MTNLLETIREAIDHAKPTRQSKAAFHAQVLLHADQISSMDKNAVCARLGVPDSYRSEIAEMLALRRYLEEHGYSVIKRQSD